VDSEQILAAAREEHLRLADLAEPVEAIEHERPEVAETLDAGEPTRERRPGYAARPTRPGAAVRVSISRSP
jgi:hypothetical protein